MTDARERGVRLFAEVYGEDAAAGMVRYMDGEDFGVQTARWAAEFCFGEVWPREGLDRKLRSCVVLGMLIALRQPEEIAYHTRMGLANGLTPGELEEIIYSAIPYCGFPAANSAKAVMQKVLTEEHKL